MHRESRQSDSSYLQLLGIRAIVSNNTNSFKKQFNNEHIKHLAIEKVIQTDTHRGCVFGLKFSPDGKYLAAATSKYIIFRHPYFCIFIFKELPSNLFFRTKADSVEIWEHARGKKTMVLTDHKEIVTSILWMKTNPQCFYTSSLDKTIKFYRDFTPVATLSDHAGKLNNEYKTTYYKVINHFKRNSEFVERDLKISKFLKSSILISNHI